MRAFCLAWRALGLWLTHSRSRASERWRALRGHGAGLVLLAGDGFDVDVSLIGAIQRGAAVSLYFALLTNIFFGWITIPLGMIASVLVTLWARRQVITT